MFGANKRDLSLVTVQMQFILGQPVLNVDIAVRCGFQKRRDVFENVGNLWLLSMKMWSGQYVRLLNESVNAHAVY